MSPLLYCLLVVKSLCVSGRRRRTRRLSYSRSHSYEGGERGEERKRERESARARERASERASEREREREGNTNSSGKANTHARQALLCAPLNRQRCLKTRANRVQNPQKHYTLVSHVASLAGAPKQTSIEEAQTGSASQERFKGIPATNASAEDMEAPTEGAHGQCIRTAARTRIQRQWSSS